MKENDDLAVRVRHAFWIAVGLVIFVLLIPPALIGGKEDALGGFVEHYQTLIAGVLAVFAAWATISEMRRTELAQRLRHDEQMWLLQRNDDLAIMRCVDYAPKALRGVAYHARRFAEHPEVREDGVIWTTGSATAFVWAVNSARVTLEILKSSEITACAHLFTPQLRTTLEGCRQHADLAIVAYGEDFDLLMAVNPDVERVARWAPHAGTKLLIDYLAVIQEQLAAEFESWAANIHRRG
ncbi:hypothetical protein ACIQUG_27340 [Ensifer sp. NPDC090286]|uniref:hypothetical protein n=1 Tax=Ensifer sp. NPDC090286 TaxID=3363991 RepID=UPI00383B5344